MQRPEVFFCPSNEDPQSNFNTEVNPWPPGPDGDPNNNAWAGYGGRPQYELPDEVHKTSPHLMPRLADFHTKAIFADLTAVPARVNLRHRIGVNVLCGDGSAEWVARSVFNEPLEQCTRPDDAKFNPQQDAIWAAFDKALAR
jgi:hypothetical protein